MTKRKDIKRNFVINKVESPFNSVFERTCAEGLDDNAKTYNAMIKLDKIVHTKVIADIKQAIADIKAEYQSKYGVAINGVTFAEARLKDGDEIKRFNEDSGKMEVSPRTQGSYQFNLCNKDPNERLIRYTNKIINYKDGKPVFEIMTKENNLFTKDCVVNVAFSINTTNFLNKPNITTYLNAIQFVRPAENTYEVDTSTFEVDEEDEEAAAIRAENSMEF